MIIIIILIINIIIIIVVVVMIITWCVICVNHKQAIRSIIHIMIYIMICTCTANIKCKLVGLILFTSIYIFNIFSETIS